MFLFAMIYRIVLSCKLNPKIIVSECLKLQYGNYRMWSDLYLFSFINAQLAF